MTIEDVIFSKLTAHAGLSAKIASRVYPVQLPQRPTLPALTYQRISTRFFPTRDQAHSSLERPRFQFDMYALTEKECSDVAQQLRSALAGLTQASSPRVYVVFVQDAQQDIHAETGQYRAIVDAFIWHEEEI